MTRHVGFILVLYSLWLRYPIISAEWTPDEYREKALNPYHYYGFGAMLAFLQVLMGIWFMRIVSITWAFIKGKPAEDTRSDEE
jgi:hypothetical protein